MKPPNGSYRLKSNPNPPGTPDMRLTISGDVGMATCGEFVYLPPPQDWFALGGPPPKVVIRFLSGTEFVAIVNPGAGPPAEKTFTGTYAPESP